MACPYYCFRQNDFYCYKKNDYVNDDVYYSYCRDYSYDDCPIYKCEETSSGCFITTACVYSLNCTDDCLILNTLRRFRDTYMQNKPNGKEEIKDYYKYAPTIVKKIDSTPNKSLIYKNLFEQYIKRCFDLINTGKYESAYHLYSKMYSDLKNKYLTKKEI